MVISANELENTLVVASSMSDTPSVWLSNRIITPIRSTNTAAIALRIHFMYDSVESPSSRPSSLRNSLVKATMLQPRTSVVTAVDTACTAQGVWMNLSRISAPMFPIRYPMMLATMTLAAVNSMFSFFFRQISRTMAMVRMVRRSSSSMSASRHDRATMACSRANMCIMKATLARFIYKVSKQLLR